MATVSDAADQPAPSEAPAASPRRSRRGNRPSARQREDRLRRALRELPAGAHSTARIAKAAGLNETKVLSRLRSLEAAGEVQRVGKRWSTERPSTDLEAAFDRLQAGTSNLRIIRPQQRVS
jgi:predicted Rossmann fold nucleotide-binding protein DprA/Smf involved in DNA uptake